MKLLVVSDIHFAGPAEQERRGHEARAIRNPALRLAARSWRRWVWLKDPLAHNHLLGRVLDANPNPDLVVANGDFTVDSAFVGISDDAALASAAEALGRLRSAYGPRLHATIGDHELGKQSLFGGVGGLRLTSWNRCVGELALRPVWRQEIGRYVLIGLPSTPVALPVFAPELLPEERQGWSRLQAEVWVQVRETFASVRPGQHIVLFVHDPSALPFLGRDEVVASRLPQVELTVVGHLHTPAIFGFGKCLAGFPRIGFLGNTVRRYSAALREARWWREFRTVLCPSPTGIELLKDGGWLDLELDPTAQKPANVLRRRLPW